MGASHEPIVERDRRTFFGVECSLACRETLLAGVDRYALRSLDGVRWIDSSNWHVTLRFIGEIPHAVVNELCAGIHRVARESAPFTIVFDQISCFPSVSRPRVIAATATPPNEGTALAHALELLCRDSGVTPDTREWRCHLSLARVRRRRVKEWRDVAVAIELAVSAVALFESVVRDGRRCYDVLERAPLGPRRDAL